MLTRYEENPQLYIAELYDNEYLKQMQVFYYCISDVFFIKHNSFAIQLS